MNAGELLARLREEIDDRVEPYRLADERLLDYLSDAEEEATLRTRFIRDASSELCRVRVRARERSVELDPRVLRVLEVLVEGGDALERTSVNDLERCRGSRSWRTERATRPTHFLTGDEDGRLTLYPALAATTPTITLELVVERMPLARLDVEEPDACPEIHPAYHAGLLEWAKHLVYSRDDAEDYDPGQAERAEARFVGAFGTRRDLEETTLLARGLPDVTHGDYF